MGPTVSTLPSYDGCAELMAITDDLSAIIRLHQSVETLLNIGIGDHLPMPHAVEIGRLSFALKVDLLMAFGLIPPDSRPAYLRFNSIRNALAHEPGASITEDTARDLRNVLSPCQRQTWSKVGFTAAEHEPGVYVRSVPYVLFAQLRRSIEHRRELRVRAEVAHERALPIARKYLPLGADRPPEEEAEIERMFRARMVEKGYERPADTREDERKPGRP